MFPNVSVYTCYKKNTWEKFRPRVIKNQYLLISVLKEKKKKKRKRQKSIDTENVRGIRRTERSDCKAMSKGMLCFYYWSEANYFTRLKQENCMHQCIECRVSFRFIARRWIETKLKILRKLSLIINLSLFYRTKKFGVLENSNDF